jgi:hypothetical protein
MTYAATAIVSPYDTRSMKNGGASALTSKRIMKVTADKTVDVATASTDALYGVLAQSSGVAVSGDSSSAPNAVGAYENVQTRGKAVLTAGGVVPIGVPVTSDSVGRGINASSLVAAGTPCSLIGFAATAASGAAVDFEVEFYPSRMFNNTPGLSVATHAALKAIAAADRYDGMLIVTQNDNATWRFSAAGTAVDTSENLIVAPTAGTGIWLRVDDLVVMELAATYATSDAAVLFTVPAGCYLKPVGFAWHVTTSFAGGTVSTIGVSSGTLTGYTTKGDLLGGSAGDAAATLVSTGATYKAGTIGPKFDSLAERDACVLAPADTIRWDRITDAYTSGVGKVVVIAQVLANPGA